MISIDTLSTTTERPRKQCPRCPAVCVLTSLNYCNACSRKYLNERRAKIKAEKKQQPPAPKIENNKPQPAAYTIADLAQNPLYQRWTR